ncbi:MAG: VanZ family protein [Bacteroidota bacterium]
MNYRFLRHFLAVLIICVVTSLTLMASLYPEFVIFQYLPYIPGRDKTMHFVFMGLLGFLVTMSVGNKVIQIGKWKLWKAATILSILVTIDEFSQIFIPIRSFTFSDLAANYAGIWLFSWLAIRLLTRAEARSSDAEVV